MALRADRSTSEGSGHAAEAVAGADAATAVALRAAAPSTDRCVVDIVGMPTGAYGAETVARRVAG